MPSTDINRVYRLLFDAYGPQGWWPGDTPFEVCAGAILTQQTSWGNVERALASLKKNGLLSCNSISNMPLPELENYLFPTGFYRQKSQRLRNFCQHLQNEYGCQEKILLSKPLQDARGELLSLKGIGKETADSMLLYAGEHPVFVVDAYTFRILSRLEGKEYNDYDMVQNTFHRMLERDLEVYREYHALIVEHAKNSCTKTAPMCSKCPLSNICKESTVSHIRGGTS